MSRPNTMYGTAERDDELPSTAPTPLLELLGPGGAIEVGGLTRIVMTANDAVIDINRAIEANNVVDLVTAADKLAKAGDLLAAARRFARIADRLLSKGGKSE